MDRHGQRSNTDPQETDLPDFFTQGVALTRQQVSDAYGMGTVDDRMNRRADDQEADTTG
ncbi:hypothetical protein G3578_01555 [Brevibacillus sp. SYP-B805]|uniref:DUF4025 domain-containing protein n=1 Tax=Brevibacillus sp. SYP-B805 TaxID=1578199 RepID=UPI0013EB6680|nr:DUF4025 domain-containing protein [Brevibacillus sp. SYP-B805]NGQ93856.1 hypothetical protein [Brevibacillus sp. SYP-B805]